MSIHQVRPIRISIDLPPEMHTHLKIACVRGGMAMQQFVRESIAKSLQDLETRLDEDAYDRGMKEIEEQGTISSAEMKKRLGL